MLVPLQFSLPLSGLWSGLSLTFRLARTVSTPSLITQGLARDYHALSRGFPEFERFYQGTELTYPKATHMFTTMPFQV